MTEQNNEKGIAETLEIGKEGGPGRRWGRWAIVVLVLAIAAAAAWYFLKPDPKAHGDASTRPSRSGGATSR